MPTEVDRRWLAAAALLPLLAFWLLDGWVGTSVALAVAFVFGAVELGWRARRTGKVDRMGALGLVLLVALAIPSWISGDERWVRLAPAVGDGIFAGLLILAEATNRSPLVAALREVEPDPHPLQIAALRALSLRLAFNLMIHAGMVAGTLEDEEAWRIVSGPAQWAMLGAQVVAEGLWMRLRVLPAIEREEAARGAGGP